MRLTSAITVAFATISTVSAQTERDLDSHDHGHAFLNIAIDGDYAFIELESPWNNFIGFEHKPRTEEQHAKLDNALALLNQPGQFFTFNGTDCENTETMLQNSLDDAHDEHSDDDAHDEHSDDDAHDEHSDDDAHDEHSDDDAHDEHSDDDAHDEHSDDDAHDEHSDDDAHDEHSDDDAHDEHSDDDAHDEHSDGDAHDEHNDDDAHDEHSEGHEHDADEDTHAAVLVTYSFECGNVSDLQSIDVGLFELMPGFEELDVQLIGPGGQHAVELSAQQITVNISKVR